MADNRLVLDIQRSVAPRVPGGVPEDRLVGMAQAATRAFQQVAQWRDDGKLSFAKLPNDRVLLEQTQQMVKAVRGQFRELVVVGIGGASLGARMLCTALAPKPAAMKVHFVDNVDPRTVGELFGRIDPMATVFNVVSKSGSTLETTAHFLVLRDLLRGRFGKKGYAERVIVTTDPDSGPLHAIAEREGLRTLTFPKDVGGRFSVLSPAGLFPAAAAGVDINALLDGARAMMDRCSTDTVLSNPAALLATVHYLADREVNRRVNVLWSYSDALRPFTEWYIQLWAQSLGKRLSLNGTEIHNGLTPLACTGAQEQHGLLQLLVEGPEDKLVTFLSVLDHQAHLEAPPAQDVPEFGFLGGMDFGAVLEAGRRSSELALQEVGRPSLRITLPVLNARAMGELIHLYEHAAAFAGALYGVDPFDQPGVEEGKKIGFGLMGRKGFEPFAEKVRQSDQNSRWRLT
ncbi:MAG: glucose-6-phosphate isomerase [Deltaproteobacteria bacterium]|nr:glucose-6-phosphate isomerase [Deltaproteobacteria bacterium]